MSFKVYLKVSCHSLTFYNYLKKRKIYEKHFFMEVIFLLFS